jgi:hypothetical protein
MAWGVVERLQAFQDFCDLALSHRAFAARSAISILRSRESFAALARPPFRPPSLPRATAAGFFFFGRDGNRKVFLGSTLPASGAPIASSTTLSAFWATSPLLDRVCMNSSSHTLRAKNQPLKPQNASLPFSQGFASPRAKGLPVTSSLSGHPHLFRSCFLWSTI